MNVSERVAELKAKIAEARRIRHTLPLGIQCRDAMREAGMAAAKKFEEETAEYVREIDALTAPIVSMVKTDNGRLFVATSQNVFELIGDTFVRLVFEIRDAS